MMDEKKMEGAMRLYEAMEGVDPDLLLRSEKPVKQKKIIPFQRFTRAAAACLALIVVGTACYATLRNLGSPKAESANFVSDSASSERAKSATDGAVNQKSEMIYNEAAAAIENEQADAPYAEEADHRDAEATVDWSAEAAMESQTNSATSSLKQDDETKIDLKGEGKFYHFVSDLNGYGNDFAGADTEEYFSDKYMEVQIGDETPFLMNYEQLSKATYVFFTQRVELRAVEDQTFTDYVTLRVYDRNGTVTDCFVVSGKYLQIMGRPGTFEIMDEGWDYEEYKWHLSEMAREE